MADTVTVPDRPGDRDQQQAAHLLNELTFGGHSWDGAEEYLTAALAAARADGDRLRQRISEIAGDLESIVRARGSLPTGTYDDGVNRAQASVAADLRAALDAE